MGRGKGLLDLGGNLRRLSSMIAKQVLVPDRVRRPPSSGWSWIDRRFLRERAPRPTREAIVLYFLAAGSDKDGLSFYSDGAIAVRLRMTEAAVVAAACIRCGVICAACGRRGGECTRR